MVCGSLGSDTCLGFSPGGFLVIISISLVVSVFRLFQSLA
jgi:hypothetical protein